MKALFGLWQDMKPADINRILKPHGVRLVVKKSKEWGKQVAVSAHQIEGAVKRPRAAKQSHTPTPEQPLPDDGLHPGTSLS